MQVSNYLFVLLPHVLVTAAAVGLRVRVSRWPVTILADRAAVLQCQAVLTGDNPLEHITVQWLHTGSQDVVHSFYYGSDQLKLQSAQYSGRTSLFHAELKHGNVSLKLRGARPSDAGNYTCHVSTLRESDEGILSVQFAAYYTEPTLTIEHTPSDIILSLRSEGYPKADVLWYRGEQKLQPVLSHTVYQQTADNLYQLQSVVKTNHTDSSTQYTVVLRNDAVKQTITRTVRLLGVEYPEHRTPELSPLSPALLAISVIALMAIIALVMLLCRQINLQSPKGLMKKWMLPTEGAIQV